MGKKEPTREDIIEALKELDTEGKQPSRKALTQKEINQYWVQKLVPEGLTELKRHLGLRITPQEEPFSDDKLLREIDKTVSKLGRVPSWAQLTRETRITEKVFKQRFGKGGICEVFTHYRKWLEEHHPESENIKRVDTYLEGQVRTKTPRLQPVERNASAIRTKWPKAPGREYGAPLNFGNLMYEPTNEQGVVFLFGMVSKWLGFSITQIDTQFPDCLAMRYIEGKRDRQQPVRIEFEYRSKDFNHIVEGCDIIVCWEDNWGNDCPLEVIELRTEIDKLRKLPEFSRT